MSIDVFYFSGTGNSYYIANEIVKKINESRLFSIVNFKVSNATAKNGNTLGIVFPVHSFSIPRVVEYFLKKVNLGEYSYIFSISTRGGSSENCLENINKLLKEKNKTLDAYFSIEMPNNTYFVHDLNTDDEISTKYKQCEEQINQIVSVIIKKEKKYYTYNEPKLKMIMFKMLHSILTKTGYGNFKNKFKVSDLCTKCGICEKVCPSSRISIAGNKVIFDINKECYICSACLNYCPINAITNKGLKPSKTQPKNQYHHLNVSYGELAKQKG